MNRRAKALLVLALVAVVAMAFRVSWNALRDVAATVGADPTAAKLYPFVVDGLMALALVAALVLPDGDRRFALRVLAGYTVASLALNYVHGLVPELHGATGRVPLSSWGPANYALVLLATSLPVGSIFFGSDLVAKVLHHKPAEAVEPVEVTTEVTAPAPVAAPKVDLPKPQTVVTRLDFDDFKWKPEKPAQTAAALPAQEPRQVVTEKVTDTPSELRRKARRLHKQLVAETGRPVTIDRLREEFGLSRRDATELRREVVTEAVAR